MADEAIFHMWKVFFREYPLCSLQATMAGLAGILSDEFGSQLEMVDFVGRTKVLLLIDGIGDDRGDIAKAQVLQVAEIF